MKGRAYWYGREIEGRLYGVQTAFWRSECPPAWERYPHLYLTTEAVSAARLRLQVAENTWSVVRRAIRLGKAVTLEVNSLGAGDIPEDIFNVAHVILRVPVGAAAMLLKTTDTVALDVSPYRCYLTWKLGWQVREPGDYAIDTEEPAL